MSDLKTKRNRASVHDFIASVDNETRRRDAKVILKLMKEITGERPAMWGQSIVGFGSFHYKYASGREGDWPATGFSPRKQNLTLYFMSGFANYDKLMAKLGKHKTGKSCLYVNKLEDIHLPTLKQLIKQSVAQVRRTQKTHK